MIEQILRASKSDRELSSILENVQEYAQVYLLAKKRQKGCDEMGEVATLKDEFSGLVEKMIAYCKLKKYLPEDISYDINLIANEVERIKKE